MRLFRMILLGLSAGGMVTPGAALAQTQTLVDVATVSMSAPGVPRTVTNTVCVTDGQDLTCDRGVYVSSGGLVGIGGAVSPLEALDVRGKAILLSNNSSPTHLSPRLRFVDTASGAIDTQPVWNFDNYRDTFRIFREPNLTTPGTIFMQMSGAQGADFHASIRATGTITSNPSGSEGGQFVLGYASATNIYGQTVGTWNIDVIPSNSFRIFRVNASNTDLVAFIISETSGNISIGNDYNPQTRLQVNGTLRVADGGESCDADRTGAIRYTGGDFWFCRNGSNWETLGSLGGGIASPTNVPAFHVKLSADQSVTGPADLPVGFNTKDFDTLGDFNTGTHQFNPSIAGRYLITVATRCWLGNGGCNAAIQKNGVSIAYGGIGTYSVATTVIQMNGTTDYVQGAVYVGSFTEKVMAHMSHMSGSLLASGNGLISGSTALGDRITSGTSAVVVNSATGIVSITQLGAVASYVHPSIGFVGPGVSTTGAVSTSRVYLSATANQCATAADIGSMFRSATTGKLQICADRN